MPAEMRSASVGGMAAGGVLLAEPEGPWHLTWPDTVAKLGGDLINGYFRSRANPDAEPDDEDEEPAGAASPPASPKPTTATPIAVGSTAGLLLAALAAVVIFKLVR